jgi:hypothetical protein
MKQSSRTRALRRVGLSSAVAVTDLRHSATTSNLVLGDNVHIVLRPSDSSVATSIDIVPANIAGQVSAVSGDTISVSGPQGVTGTIQVSTATTYSKNGSGASLSDVSVGSFIFAEGAFGSSPTTIDAATIGIRTPRLGNGPVPGNGAGPGPTGVGPFGEVPPGTQPEIGPLLRGAARK